jgi:4-amino-4-deoxy-L-arabinose transferase-like glycosyltransferase
MIRLCSHRQPRRPLAGQLPHTAALSEPSAQLSANLRTNVRSVPFWLLALLLVGLALIPRALNLSDFYTTDEAYFWQGRVARFDNALIMGDWRATNQTGHPGVTAMWLGTLGRRLSGVAGPLSPEAGAGAAYLAWLRLPLAVSNALAVGLGYLLLLQLLRPGAAFVAGLLWATSPFLIAHSRLLHLDALLASFITLSLLCLLVATQPCTPGPRRLLAMVGSGLLGGLALLTKAPALLLPPFAALVLLGAELRGRPLTWTGLRAALGPALVRFGGWLALAAATFVLLWPALWVAPLAALGAVVGEVLGNGAQPHSSGNFFMGQPVANPGWGFYAAVIAWRGEVLSLVGLGVLLLPGLVRGAHLRNAADKPRAADEPRTVATLLLFSLLFTLALTLLAKKFDRYLLPIWPALQILGALGLVRLARLILSGAARSRPVRRALRASLGVTLLVVALAPLLLYQPYYLSYYNPLLGGGAPAQQVLLTGWGEGMEQAGAWLSERPDLRRGPVLSWLPVTLSPFVPADVAVYDLDLDTILGPASYAVVYASVAERNSRIAAEAYARQTPPLHTVRVNGVTYATIHQLPRPFTNVVGAVFSGVHLRGYSHALHEATLVITPSWDIQLDRADEVFSFVHVLDAQGRRVAQIDALIDEGMFSTWQTGQQFGAPLPIALPADLPAGIYRVILGLYTQPDGVRLPLWHGEALPEAVAGPHAISLLEFRIDAEGHYEVLAP